MVVTTLYRVGNGVLIVSPGLRHRVDTQRGCGLSDFSIGWRWTRHVLALLVCLLPFLCFILGPDPYPALASKAQAARPIAAIFGQSLEIT